MAISIHLMNNDFNFGRFFAIPAYVYMPTIYFSGIFLFVFANLKSLRFTGNFFYENQHIRDAMNDFREVSMVHRVIKQKILCKHQFSIS